MKRKFNKNSIFIVILFFFLSITKVSAQSCGPYNVNLQTDSCGTVQAGVCNYNTTNYSGTCITDNGNCQPIQVTEGVTGSKCTAVAPVDVCTCLSNGSTCSTQGAGCGALTCSCSSGGSACSGSGTACGLYGLGTCNCSYTSSCSCVKGNASCGTTQVFFPSSCGSPTCTYSAWSVCSNSCGVGTTSRSGNCGTQTVSCTGTIGCPPPTPICTFGPWSSCSGTCGTQTQTDNCGHTNVQACGSCGCTPNCPSACGQNNGCNGTCPNTGNTNWGPWGNCSKACGTGSQTSTNSCGGTRSQLCNTQACTCTPSCGNNCGGSDGCSGTCPNTGNAVPVAPTGLTPATGSSISLTGGLLTLSWTGVANATAYELQIYPTGTAAGQECSVTNSVCPLPYNGTSYGITPNPGVPSYSWRVRAINTTCTTQTSPWAGPNTFSLTSSFSGNFYTDTIQAATVNPVTGQCQLGGAIALNAPGGSSINANWGGGTVPGTITNSTYAISNVPYSSNTLVNLTLPTTYHCSCPTGCTYSGLSGITQNLNFYLSSIPNNWWQTANGYIYTQATTGVGVQTQIPASCAGSGTCTAALSTYDTANTSQSDSTTITGGSTVNSNAAPGAPYTYLSQSGTNTHAEGVALNGPREDYTYFSQLYGISSSTPVTFTGTQPASSPNSAYYANGSITISTPWTLNTADSIVVFVNGNLTITKPILVAKGAFLAFIVNGNITFDKSLGSNISNTPSIAGVFVANGQIISQSNSPGDDLKLVGEGTFVGWSGISLNRTFNNANAARSIAEPIESFHYRPDFMLTVPLKMTKPLYVWQETN